MTFHASHSNSAPREVFEFLCKRPLTISEQISKLVNRGLIFRDKTLAEDYLTNISYYRLRAYTYPFQENENKAAGHKFKRNDICFSDIIDLYCFDRRLRMLLFNAIEKIEVALRARLVQTFSEDTGNSHWFTNKNLFKDTLAVDTLQNDIQKEVSRSNEEFIEHYEDKYDYPALPPAFNLKTKPECLIAQGHPGLHCKCKNYF